MEKVLIVVCHPLDNSLNHSLKNIYVEKLTNKGFFVHVSDLYKDNYNPKTLTEDYISSEISKISSSSFIILQFPIYFLSFPALLHDWIIKILLKNKSVLANKKILISATLGGSKEDYSATGSRKSLDSLINPLFFHIFTKNEGLLLQPFLIFSSNSLSKLQILQKFEELESKLENFVLWPEKLNLIEDGF